MIHARSLLGEWRGAVSDGVEILAATFGGWDFSTAARRPPAQPDDRRRRRSGGGRRRRRGYGNSRRLHRDSFCAAVAAVFCDGGGPTFFGVAGATGAAVGVAGVFRARVTVCRGCV